MLCNTLDIISLILLSGNVLVSSFTSIATSSTNTRFALVPSSKDDNKLQRHERNVIKSLSFIHNNDKYDNRMMSIQLQARKKGNSIDDDDDDDDEDEDEGEFEADIFHEVINGEEEDDDIEYEYEDDVEDDVEDDEDDEEEEIEEVEEDNISISQKKILNKIEEMDIELKLEMDEEMNRDTSAYVDFASKDEPSISKKQEKELFIDTSSFDLSEEKLQKMFDKFTSVNQKMKENNKDFDAEIDADEYPENDDEIYSKLSKAGNVTREGLVSLESEYNTLLQNQKELFESDDNENARGGLLKNIDFIIDDEYILSSDNTDLSEQVKQEIFNVDYWAESDEDPELLTIREQRRRLIYDLDYNVTNLFLSSVKVNPDAPLLLENWLLALRNQTKYEYVRDNHFNFTWDEVHQANVTELHQYYINAGFDSTPTNNSTDLAQNNPMVEWDESSLTFEEEQMLAFENWMDAVYQDVDDICLDDEDFMPHDNPAAVDLDTVVSQQNTNTSTTVNPMIKDVQEFEEKYEHMSQDWRDQYVKRYQYQVEEQDEKNKDFRGHLVIACSPSDDDLTIAEKLTLRMEKSFGTQVFVETRVVGHAKLEDNLYEIWLESWDIDLLFSKRSAVFNPREWDGPREVTDEYIDELVDQVKFLTSDDARYSYRYD